MQWDLAQRNGMQIRAEKDNVTYDLEWDLEDFYGGFLDHESFGTAEGRASFFDSYYGGFQVLRTEADFYDLAMDYFGRAGIQNNRYCEPFFSMSKATLAVVCRLTQSRKVSEGRRLIPKRVSTLVADNC